MYFNKANLKSQKEMFSQIQNRNYTFSCGGNSSKNSKPKTNTNNVFDNLNKHLSENMLFLNTIEKDPKVKQNNIQQQRRMLHRQKQAMVMKKGCGCGGK